MCICIEVIPSETVTSIQTIFGTSKTSSGMLHHIIPSGPFILDRESSRALGRCYSRYRRRDHEKANRNHCGKHSPELRNTFVRSLSTDKTRFSPHCLLSRYFHAYLFSHSLSKTRLRNQSLPTNNTWSALGLRRSPKR